MKYKAKYILLGLLLIIGLGAILMFFRSGNITRDIPPINDEDLKLSKIEIPEENNLVYEFAPWLDEGTRRIIWPNEEERPGENKKLYWPEKIDNSIKAMRKGKNWNNELVYEVLNKNRELLDKLEEIIEKKQLTFQTPLWENPENLKMEATHPNFENYKRIADLNLLQAFYLFKNGNQEEGLDHAIYSVKLGYLMQRAPHQNLITYLMGAQTEKRALEAFKEMINETTLSAKNLTQYILKLEQFKNHQEGVKLALKSEYQVTMNAKRDYFDKDKKGELSEYQKQMEEIIEEELGFSSKLKHSYNPNATEKIIAEHYRPYAVRTFKFYKDVPQWEYPNSIKNSDFMDKKWFEKNLLGRTYAYHALPRLTIVLTKAYDLNFQKNSAQLLVALKTYKQEKGVLPDKLERLTPNYIKEIPLDSFDGEPIRYSKEKKILFSVGENLKNDGGDPQKDLVTEINF